MKVTPHVLIGQKVIEVRYRYIPENEYGLQEFVSFFRLSNGSIIQIPCCPGEEWRNNNEFLLINYADSESVGEELSAMVFNREIRNIHFLYYKNEPDEQEKAIIELENGLFITEKNVGPVGITNVDLQVMNEQQFFDFKQRLGVDFELKSLNA